MKRLTQLISVFIVFASCSNNTKQEVIVNTEKPLIKTSEQTINIDTILPNGDVYLGEWKNNKPNGKGLLVLDNNTRFDGFFVNGKLEGFGTKINGFLKNGEFIQVYTEE